MRQIKFRVWNPVKKSFLRSYKDKGLSFGVGSNSNMEQFGCYDIEQCLDFGFIIQQFTGLLDKNGKEIYEGDIIMSNYYSSFQDKYELTKDVVVFQNGCFVAKYYKLWENEAHGGSMLLDSRDLEAIGNIFENRELLTENPELLK